MTIQFGDQEPLLFASSWDELTPRQTQGILSIYYKSQLKGVNEWYTRVLITCYLINYSPKYYYDPVQKRAESLTLLSEKLTDWMFDDVGALSYTSYKSPILYIRIGIKKHIHVGDLLMGITFGEFRKSTIYLQQYFELKNKESLLNLASTLYRCKVKKLAMWKLLSIATWFSYCVSYIHNSPVVIDGKELNFSVLFSSSKSDDNDNNSIGWTGVLFSIAEKNVFGNVDSVDNTGLFEVLTYLYNKNLEAKHYDKHK